MLWLYRNVFTEAVRRSIRSWPAVLSLLVYAVILTIASKLASRLGIVGSLLFGLVYAACWSSYLELISQAVSAPKFRITWDEFRMTFWVRFGDVISVMFAFWIISFVMAAMMRGPQAMAIWGITSFAMAFFFNAVPELLYLGNSRSFALLIESAKFVMEHPVVWFLPNIVLAALALWAGGALNVRHPAELLILFGSVFSSPDGVAKLILGFPIWGIPFALLGLHFAMVLRGLLFKELSSGRSNPRWREFQSRMR